MPYSFSITVYRLTFYFNYNPTKIFFCLHYKQTNKINQLLIYVWFIPTYPFLLERVDLQKGDTNYLQRQDSESYKNFQPFIIFLPVCIWIKVPFLWLWFWHGCMDRGESFCQRTLVKGILWWHSKVSRHDITSIYRSEPSLKWTGKLGLEKFGPKCNFFKAIFKAHLQFLDDFGMTSRVW